MSGTSESRIAALVDLLTRLASGDLAARGSRSSADDEIDAVIEGVNMLAEELEASRAELEQRVRERTDELEQVNRDILRLAELANLLQACEVAEEAYSVLADGFADMFGDLSGAMYLYRASRNILELKATWGSHAAPESMTPTGCWALRRGLPHFVDVAHPSLSCPHVAERTGDSICIPMSAHGETIGVMHLMGQRPDSPGPTLGLTPAKRQLAIAAGEQTALALANLELREKLQVQALRDPLTGLYNRRFVDEWLDREVSRTDRSGRSLGVIMADIDHFKRVNDLHGHDAGDELLKGIAETLRSALRPTDMACRYGGEEFLILLGDVATGSLHARAEVLRGLVSELRVQYRGSYLPSITLSAGVALYPQNGSTADQVVQAADTALYEAKSAGRNRTSTAT